MSHKKGLRKCERELLGGDRSVEKVGFPCVFFVDVLCSYRKSSTLGIMEKCWKCRHFKRFNREMDKEDKEFWAWEEKVRKNPERYLRGEL